MRATWTDERLDDLARRVDYGFGRLDEDLRSLRTDLSARIDAQGANLATRIDAQGADLGRRIDAQGARVDAQGADLVARIDVQGADLGRGIDSQAGRIDALERTMLQVGVGMIVTLVVGFAGLFATHL
jgi:hypothetical protein